MADILSEQAETTETKPAREEGSSHGDTPKRLPKGVVLGKDGKPYTEAYIHPLFPLSCRSCTSVASWAAMARSSTKSSSPSTTTKPAAAAAAAAALQPPKNCPPDVDTLGNHTWTLLHSLTANYPTTASPPQQREMAQFLTLFSRLYPCWVCADDFRAWMEDNRNGPRLGSRDEFGTWMCEAHNEVNRKLGKREFDCSRWAERWRDGWKDGSCD
ncbi:MAG: hypothetical protein M4579_005866 [Chaenotheca gracillima]|nr:MAG: hypothetical protein M4579_005866 [Chaenotheca gracillima]